MGLAGPKGDLMQPTKDDRKEKLFLAALDGLGHRLPQVRAQYARFLRKSGGAEALEALKSACLVESNILCKTEMIRAIVALEESLGLTPSPSVALEGANPYR